MVRSILLVSLPFALSFGCGGAQKVKSVPDICNLALSSLKQQLGPELGKVEAKVRSTRPERVAHACIVAYSRVPEELPEELEDGDDLDLELDHRLAIVVDPDRGAPQFRRISPSKASPGPVGVIIRGQDVTGDGHLDFVVEERAAIKGDALGYRGLRLFAGGPANKGQEIFSDRLLLKTPEGLKIVPRWTTKTTKGHQLLLLTGGGQSETYRYNTSFRRFEKVNQPAPKAQARPEAQPSAPKTAAPTKDEVPKGILLLD
jgi:hypothetical protein